MRARFGDRLDDRAAVLGGAALQFFGKRGVSRHGHRDLVHNQSISYHVDHINPIRSPKPIGALRAFTCLGETRS